MKLAYFTPLYPAYLDQLYARHPGLERRDWASQRAAIDQDAFGWIGLWPRVLTPLGYQVFEVLLNAAALQRAWRAGHAGGERGASPEEIPLPPVRPFPPQGLWCDHHHD